MFVKDLGVGEKVNTSVLFHFFTRTMEKVLIFDHKRVKSLLTGAGFVVDSTSLSKSTEPTGIQQRNEHKWNLMQPSPQQNTSDDPLTCLTCDVNFSSREEQLYHYKSDWHRYNLKLKVNGQTAVSPDEFEDIINEISSISGSDSDSDNAYASNSVISNMARVDKAMSAVELSPSVSSLQNTSNMSDESFRTPKIYLRSSDGMIFSIYRSILSKEYTEFNEMTVSTIQSDVFRPVKCLIILLSAGHFAACVFDGNTPIIHKTFHRYILRAKQGTVQSVRDGRGNAPKSGGAALRRHNEAALATDIQNLLNSWKADYVETSTHIFIRTPHYGKIIFYHGKAAPLQRKDVRIRGIPFPTRRPTFNELKRVHKELFSISINEEMESCVVKKPLNQTDAAKSLTMKPMVEIPETTTANASQEIHGPNIESPTTNKMNFKKKKRKKEESGGQTKEPVALPQEVQLAEKQDPVIDELYTTCKVGNLVGLQAILASIVKEYSEETSADNIISVYLNQPITKTEDRLLHVAAKSGHQNIIHHLLERGADPSIKNSQSIVPYLATSDKSTRNVFRKFMALYPEKYDYKASEIPSPLTEEMENERKQKLQERKKAHRALKKEKMKEKKVANKKLESEQLEKERFAALSEREKRAIAAERRFAQQLAAQGNSVPNTALRCWLCGASLLGKIPFEYYDYQFCSINCLKKHKSLENVNR